MSTSTSSSLQLVASLWKQLRLPESALSVLHLQESVVPFSASHLPSSFRIDDLAQGTIGLFHLAAGYYHSISTGSPLCRVTVSPLAAALEFKSETHFEIDGKPLAFPTGFGGLYLTKDGHVRIHDGFRVHQAGTKRILGLEDDAGREDVANECSSRAALDLEEAAFGGHAVIAALRSFEEWDSTPAGRSVPDNPITLQSITPTSAVNRPAVDHSPSASLRALNGIRVIELSRVIAIPVAGRALAAHGADVLWVTSPSLEDQPYLDRDFARGKRTIQLDLRNAADLLKLKDLVKDADVFLQGFRPGSLAKRGLGYEDLHRINPRLVYASMSAYPQTKLNPWRWNRGFDSMVQTCSGLNVAEAERYSAHDPGENIVAKPLPCQALDHGGGFLLASGIVAALCRRQETGLGQIVEVSLAATSRLLRSLGQIEGSEAFENKTNTRSIPEVLHQYGSLAATMFGECESEFGNMMFVKPAGQVEGLQVGWSRMPRPLGSDKSERLNL